MRARSFPLVLAAVVLTGLAAPLVAHHSTANFDSEKEIVLKGVDDYTFVVTTIGSDERTWLSNAGDPHSNDLKAEERYRRVNRDRLELTVVLDDPKVYTKPWVGRDKLPLNLLPPDTDLMEMIPSASEAAEYRRIMAGPRK